MDLQSFRRHVANIDNLKTVHANTLCYYIFGNTRQRLFSKIWTNTTGPPMDELKQCLRPLEGRREVCHCQSICNGNTRDDTHQSTRNFWTEDSGCYLTDQEI